MILTHEHGHGIIITSSVKECNIRETLFYQQVEYYYIVRRQTRW